MSLNGYLLIIFLSQERRLLSFRATTLAKSAVRKPPRQPTP